jgi:tyrosinase
MDSDNPNHDKGKIWNSQFLGGNGQGANLIVQDGDFGQTVGTWTLQQRVPSDLSAAAFSYTTAAPGFLVRQLNRSGTRLPSQDEIDHTINRIATFDDNYFAFYSDGDPQNSTSNSFRAVLEGWSPTTAVKRKHESSMHNGVHVWVGGNMGIPRVSPNDPAFWLHHCNVDRFWALWQVRHPSLADQYPTDAAIDNVRTTAGSNGETNPNARKLDEAQPPWESASKVWTKPDGTPVLTTDVYTIRNVLNWTVMGAGLGGYQIEGVNASAIAF